jgi:hypothetical protein
MSGQLGELVISLQADMARFTTDMGKASKVSQETAQAMTSQFKEFQNSMDSMSSSVSAGLATIAKGAALVTAVVAGGKMFGSAVSEATEWNSQIVKLAATLGMSTQEASGFSSALNHLGIDQDTVTTAMQKMVKTATSSPDVFKQLGIAVTDTNTGALLPTTVIFENVRDRLLEFKSGSSRAGAASLIFGRGAKDLTALMKLLSEEIDQGAERVKALGIVVTEEGAKKTADYKKATNDLKESFSSIGKVIGIELLPPLMRLAKTFSSSATENMGAFQAGLLNTEIGVYRLANAFDQIGCTFSATLAVMSGGNFTEAGKEWFITSDAFLKRMQGNNAEIDKLDNRLAGKNEDGSKPKPYKPQGGGTDTLDPSTVGKQKKEPKGVDQTHIVNAAHEKYLEYEKAFEERNAAQVRIANDFELEMNRQAYALGLTDLDTFLNKKAALTMSSLNAEVAAKTKELSNAQKSLNALKSAKDGDDAESVKNYNAALLKEELAQKALAEAVGKVTKEKEVLKDSDREAIALSDRGYQEQIAALLDFQGEYVKAAEIRKKLDEESHARKQLEANALHGDTNAIKALASAQTIDGTKAISAQSKESKESADLNFDNQDLKNQISGNKYDALDTQHEKDSAPVNARLAELDALSDLNDKQVDEYNAMVDKLDLIDEKHAKDKKKLDDDNLTSVGNSLGALGAIMMKGNKEQFEAGKKLAIAGATIQMISAGMAAFAGITASTGGWGMAAGIAEMALAVGVGTAQIAQIESTQYEGRALGGTVNAGQTYVVNENRATQGPEYFTPGVSGTITPANKMGGGSTTSVTQVLQITAGVPEIVRSEISRMAPMIQQLAVQAVQQAQRDGQMQ